MSIKDNQQQYRIVIWGLGKDYNRHVSLLRYAEAGNEIQVVALTANEIPNVKKLDGWRVIDKENLLAADFDYIVVMNEKFFGEITADIINLGVGRKKIIPCRVMDIPYFNWKSYIEILESEVSIVCNNCWGGILYRTLGLECRSPFKNLALGARELMHILSDPKHYLSVTPRFVKWRKEPHSGITYPVLAVDDVEIHFNHDTVVEEAVEKWTRRCRKFNYDNIFVSIYTEEEDVIEQFLRLEEYPNRICFIPFQGSDNRFREISNIYELDLLPGQSEFWEPVNSNVSNTKNSLAFDILAMLHMERKYRTER